MNRPILRDSFLSTNFRTSKFFTSAAKVTGKAEASKAVIGAIPLLPASRFFQISGTVLPTPHRSPIPVITTRLGKLLACLRMLVDVLDSVLYSLDLLGILVRNLEVECLFKLHYQLDHVERIRTEIFLK